MSNLPSEFPLYLSNISVKEKDTPELVLTYEGDETLVDKLFLIGKNNGLPDNINAAIPFEQKKLKGRVVFQITIPIYEDGEFQAVVEYEDGYIYEPGQAHSIVFRGKGIFLDFRKIYHLQKEVLRPKGAPKPTKKEAETEKIETIKEEKKATSTLEKKKEIAPIADKDNLLKVQPKDFRNFDKNLKAKLLQILDYLANDKSKKLILDTVILPDISRTLKRLILEEMRKSVYEACFPVIVLIEKALILGGMVFQVIFTEETYEEYKKEIVEKIPEIKERINHIEFEPTNTMIKVKYDKDKHSFKKMLYHQI
ncbi:MAG: hypothetical protein K9W46_07510 [Candidatus Heimdallarchaeum endolithica]|uniref:Uncharacterized protein n=1 Tax=Candidatus Heimdallarchaeum endolithica TaxID=2876572 RepID=A0A9Y1FN39_9ARCH|nr:MAG: hypothetical protein K9W46_07510 [Candidatus Heimdallarchaeum endolithica]